ncbi:MAG: S23 ribosomal protein [Ignavibacteria bacterium]|nr:MAG: S23 ribosomal protein [Ignavibacteria bacterium]KAF0161772.1 MAG: S23 ribosomal protein [Ignavibacteria bacterium]
MLVLNHKKLEVYSKILELVTLVYKITSSFPRSETFGLTSQMQRASVSVMSNLAEGASRKSAVERKRFFEISRSSLVELDSQFEISERLGLSKEIDKDKLSSLLNSVFAQLSNLIKNTK